MATNYSETMYFSWQRRNLWLYLVLHGVVFQVIQLVMR